MISSSTLTSPPKLLHAKVAEGAPPTRRVRTDIQLVAGINRDDTEFRDRFALALFPFSGGQTPHVTKQADLESTFPNPMDG